MSDLLIIQTTAEQEKITAQIIKLTYQFVSLFFTVSQGVRTNKINTAHSSNNCPSCCITYCITMSVCEVLVPYLGFSSCWFCVFWPPALRGRTAPSCRWEPTDAPSSCQCGRDPEYESLLDGTWGRSPAEKERGEAGRGKWGEVGGIRVERWGVEVKR